MLFIHRPFYTRLLISGLLFFFQIRILLFILLNMGRLGVVCLIFWNNFFVYMLFIYC